MTHHLRAVRAVTLLRFCRTCVCLTCSRGVLSLAACCRLATGASDPVGALVSKQQLCFIVVVLHIARVSCDSFMAVRELCCGHAAYYSDQALRPVHGSAGCAVQAFVSAFVLC